MLVLAACPLAASAQSDYSDKESGLRIASAFLRFTEVSTLGGETVANRTSSAINPASVAWYPLPGTLGVVVSPYFSTIMFDNGTNLYLTGESATWDTRAWGVFQPTLSQIRSNDATGRDGLSFDYDVDIEQLQWGKRFGNLAVGACFNYAHAQINRGATLMEKFGPASIPVNVDSHSGADSYRWRFGALYQPAEKWLIGSIFEYGFQPYLSRTIVTPLPYPAMRSELDDDGLQQQFVFRPGVSYEYLPMCTVYADYQYGYFFNRDQALNSHLFTLGIEHRVLEWLFLRAGPTIDARGNIGFSCGASIFLAKWCSLEIGYQYNMLSELRPELGRANTIQAVLAIRF